MITARDKRFYDLALKVAALSEYKHKHGCLIVAGNRIVALATNTKRTHPVSHRFRCRATIHAEQRALISRRCDVTGMALFSARIGGNQCSRPCDLCMWYIRESGLRDIVYWQDGKLVKERL